MRALVGLMPHPVMSKTESDEILRRMLTTFRKRSEVVLFNPPFLLAALAVFVDVNTPALIS